MIGSSGSMVSSWWRSSQSGRTARYAFRVCADALVAINALNRGWAGQLPSASVRNQLQRTELLYLIDTNNDGHASPIDVLRIIRHLNAGQASPAAAVDAVLAASLWEDDEAERGTPME